MNGDMIRRVYENIAFVITTQCTADVSPSLPYSIHTHVSWLIATAFDLFRLNLGQGQAAQQSQRHSSYKKTGEHYEKEEGEPPFVHSVACRRCSE